MYILVHLALPAIVALAMTVANSHLEWNVGWFDQTISNYGYMCLTFSLPHWVWATISGYFEVSNGATVGGLMGAHILLLAVWIFVSTSSVPEAANGWFLYFLGSPIAISFGALAGRHVALSKEQ